MFSTWPEDVVKQVAEESRLQDYNSDEVIVRDSSKLHWIIFITKVSWIIFITTVRTSGMRVG